MKFLFKILQRIYFLYSIIVFLLIMLLLFIPTLIASVWGRIKGGNFVYKLTKIWADVCFAFCFIFTKIKFESPHNPNRAYIFVVNHISYIDAGFLPKVFRQPLRILGKAEMTKIPIFGSIYSKVVVPVYRDRAHDRARSMQIVKSLVNKKISVLIFAEGTFNQTGKPLKDFYNGAFRIAIDTQTPIKPVLFLDTYARMPGSLWTLNPGKCRAIYLDEISVEGLTLDDLPALKEKTHNIMSERLRAYGAIWIKDEQEIKTAH
jgi:1-acyl-sn-glycerol-3-phosphate acyltransferase